METPVTPTPVQAAINKSPHNSPKKKFPSYPRQTFYNQEYRNSNLGSSQGSSNKNEVRDRPMLVAKRRVVNSKPADAKSSSENQIKPTDNASDQEAQSSQMNQVKPNESPKSESRVAETFKEFQMMRRQHQRSRRNGFNSQNNKGWQNNVDVPDPDAGKKVLVSDFPSYTRVQDLLRVLSELGTVDILRCKNRLAVVMFESEELARKALDASDQLYLFGEFLKIKPYTNARHVEELYRANKKVFKQIEQEIISPTKIDLSGDFEQQFENIQRAVRLTKEEVEEVAQLYADVETVLRTVWPGCEAIPFGSIPTGLGIKSSDADCFVAGVPAPAEFCARARRALAARPELFAQLVAIPRANTPIVKLLHVPSRRRADLSAKSPLGAHNSRLVRHLLGARPPLAAAAVALKYWARAQRLSGTGRLTNYALVLLLLFYLQRRGLAPPVAELQTPASAVLVGGWDAGFEPRPLPPLGDVGAADLLGGFFAFYAEFDFDASVACPLTGEPVPKAAFEAPRSLPPAFARYADNVERGLTGALRVGAALCVQDPFELSHNVASGVSTPLARQLRALLRLARDAFERDTEPGRPRWLREALLARPAPVRAPPTTRVRLLPRGPAAAAALGAAWRERVRGALVQLLAQQLRCGVEREAGGGRERYAVDVPCAVWRRRAGPAPAGLRLELELGWGPDSCSLLARHVAGDLDHFRLMSRFLHTTLLERFRALLALETPPRPAADSFEPEAGEPAESSERTESAATLLAAITLHAEP